MLISPHKSGGAQQWNLSSTNLWSIPELQALYQMSLENLGKPCPVICFVLYQEELIPEGH